MAESKPNGYINEVGVNSQSSTLSIDEKRQIIYSSLLRYSSEAISLRESALDRVVLGALLDSAEHRPYRIGQIQANLRFSPGAPEIRIEAIEETLNRLCEQGKVQMVNVERKPGKGWKRAYFLTPAGYSNVGEIGCSTEELFQRVLPKMLRGAEGTVPPTLGAAICRKFIFECFARYGQTIARNVTGQLSHDALIRQIDVTGGFNL